MFFNPLIIFSDSSICLSSTTISDSNPATLFSDSLNESSTTFFSVLHFSTSALPSATLDSKLFTFSFNSSTSFPLLPILSLISSSALTFLFLSSNSFASKALSFASNSFILLSFSSLAILNSSTSFSSSSIPSPF
uniref:Uncharacterized protein n=1 Tax=Brassica oleracea var. oleracea TaxID=109376 RepID=A0A0D3C842_BRAOL